MTLIYMAMFLTFVGGLFGVAFYWDGKRRRRSLLLRRISDNTPLKAAEGTLPHSKIEQLKPLLRSRKALYCCLIFSVLMAVFYLSGVGREWVLGAVLPMFLGGWGAVFYARWRWKKHCTLIEQQIPDALEMMARMAKVGVAPEQIFVRLVPEMPPPIQQIFLTINQYMKIGVPMEKAMARAFQTYDNQDLFYLQSILALQRKMGGNYADIVGMLAQTVRERHRQHQQLNVITSEARAAAKVVGLLSFVSVGALFFLNRDQFDFLISHETGHGLLIYAAGSSLLGLLVIHRMLKVVG